jgi:hypothetical protein
MAGGISPNKEIMTRSGPDTEGIPLLKSQTNAGT